MLDGRVEWFTQLTVGCTSYSWRRARQAGPSTREQRSVALYPQRHQVLRTNARSGPGRECSQDWSLGKGGRVWQTWKTRLTNPTEQKAGKTIFLRVPCSQSAGMGTHSHQLDLEAEVGRAHLLQTSLVVTAGGRQHGA